MIFFSCNNIEHNKVNGHYFGKGLQIRMKIIDLENHFYSDFLLEALSERTEPPYYRIVGEDCFLHYNHMVAFKDTLIPKLVEIGEKRIEYLKENGIDAAVLCSSGCGEQLDVDVSIDVCRNTNDMIGALTKEFPGIYYGSAMLPVNDPEAACEELERCVKEYGFVCWHTHSNYGENHPEDEKYWPLFKKAADLGVYVYLHPHMPVEDRLCDLGFTFAGPGLGFTVDTATTALRMIVKGIFDEIPNLKVVLGHLGEGIPPLLERIDNRLSFVPNPHVKSKHTVEYYFNNNIYVTTSGNLSYNSFDAAVDKMGIDRLLFETDYPYEGVEEMMEFVRSIPLSEEDRKKLYYENAVNELNIKF